MTAQELINAALRSIGVLASGETPSTEESADAFTALNHLLGSWSNERIMVYSIQHTSYTLFQGVNAFTLGPGGSWSTASRAVKIEGATAVFGAFRQGLEVMPIPEFAAKSTDAIGSTAALPRLMGVDNAFPLLNVRVWPTPNITSGIDVHYWQALSSLGSLADVLNFPQGYERALRFALALDLAPEFGRPVSQELAALAAQSKDAIAQVSTAMRAAAPAPAQQ